ncbi:MAG: hypothetical protein WEB60_06470 [Terrimicrobiaceae bacterium]
MKLPERLKSSRFDPDKALSLRCAEVFANPQPSIDVARLAEMAPEDIAPDFLHAGTIPISPALLALRYQFLHSVEQIEAPVVEPVPELPAVVPAEEDPVLSGPVIEAAPVIPLIKTPAVVEVPPTPPAQSIENPVAKMASPDVPPPPAAKQEARPEPPLPSPPAAPIGESPVGLVSLPPTPRSSTQDADPGDSKSQAKPRPVARIPDKRTIFNILPALRRHSAAPKPVTPQAPLARESGPTEELPMAPGGGPAKIAELPAILTPSLEEPAVREAVSPKTTPVPPQDLEAPEQALPSPVMPPPVVPKPVEHIEPTNPMDPAPVAPEPETPKVLNIEHLPPAKLKTTPAVARELESAPDESLAAQDRLQEIFMTEEQLTLDQVLKLCGGLPGIRSCILTKGSSVLSSFNVPDGIDVVSLTGNASAMLDAIRTSSMRMGLGAIPAVTVHSEKGPVSFFHSDDLAMLILHADRGFIPGVREKIHDVVVALGQSNIPLPLERSSET